MAEPLPRSPDRPEPSEADYDAFCATVMASARGRWFLAEYARRHRKADTDTVLAALHRIEDLVRATPEASPVTRLRDELRALAALIREARRDLTAGGGTLSSVAKVMALLDLLEQRIEVALAPGDDRAPLPPPAEPASASPDMARSRLTVVAETAAPAAARIDPSVFPSAALLPALDPADAGPNVVVIARTSSRALGAPAPQPSALFPEPAPLATRLTPKAPDLPLKHGAAPFADVMALSEEERVALFS